MTASAQPGSQPLPQSPMASGSGSGQWLREEEELQEEGQEGRLGRQEEEVRQEEGQEEVATTLAATGECVFRGPGFRRGLFFLQRLAADDPAAALVEDQERVQRDRRDHATREEEDVARRLLDLLR